MNTPSDHRSAKPMSMDAFNKRFHRNLVITGHGTEITISTPCPFCAAADWMTYHIMNVREAIAKGATCKACGRSAMAIFADQPNDTRFELVQTGGPPQPEWLTPQMRRVS